LRHLAGGDTHAVGLATLLIAAVVSTLAPVQKARLVVVTSERPGVFVGAAGIRFADQEGGAARAFPDLPPWRSASGYDSIPEAYAAGRATARALRAQRVDLDLAPALDLADGPLGSRQFRRPELGVAFARGLGRAACPKHFPGLGTAPVSTDERPHVDAVVRDADLRPFRAAIHAGARCVMVGHAFYGTRFRASLEPATYRLLRSTGFDGVAITDSLSIVREAPVERWARQAVRAGADLVLFTSPAHARRAVAALIPLARRGELDDHVERVLELAWAR
jgi:beta-glucosidase-like glycosyl hydrolase